MRSPELDAERIEKLVAGMPPESEREARLEGIVRELRAGAPIAPPLARERVRVLREPERRRFAWRPALVALPIAAAMIAGAVAFSRGGSSASGDSAGGAEAASTTPAFRPTAPQQGADRRQLAPAWVQAQGKEAVPAVRGPALDTATARAQEWDVTLELRVPHNDRLSDASADAIRTTRALGGYVVSSSVATHERAGEAQLVLRVPSRRIQDAIAQLSALGTITGQGVTIQDRQAELDRLARRIDALRVRIAELNLRLRTESLSAPERLRLELQVQRLRASLNSAGSSRRGVAREVALAEVALTIRTGTSAAPPGEGRIGGAARDALHVLGVAGAVAVFLLIVLSPLLVLGAVAVLARRVWRRRENERLLAQPRPAAE